MTAMAGIATAFFIVQNSPTQQPEPTQSNSIEETSPTETTLGSSFDPHHNWQSNTAELSLLSDHERLSLTPTPIHPTQTIIPAEPITQLGTNWEVTLYNWHDSEQVFGLDEKVPKYVRQLTFQINRFDTTASGLTVRWLWQRQLMQTEKVTTIDNERFQSKIELFSGRQGVWDIEILDPSDQVIYRYNFIYVQ